jgi:hypothetical protein
MMRRSAGSGGCGPGAGVVPKTARVVGAITMAVGRRTALLATLLIHCLAESAAPAAYACSCPQGYERNDIGAVSSACEPCVERRCGLVVDRHVEKVHAVLPPRPRRSPLSVSSPPHAPFTPRLSHPSPQFSIAASSRRLSASPPQNGGTTARTMFMRNMEQGRCVRFYYYLHLLEGDTTGCEKCAADRRTFSRPCMRCRNSVAAVANLSHHLGALGLPVRGCYSSQRILTTSRLPTRTRARKGRGRPGNRDPRYGTKKILTVGTLLTRTRARKGKEHPRGNIGVQLFYPLGHPQQEGPLEGDW